MSTPDVVIDLEPALFAAVVGDAYTPPIAEGTLEYEPEIEYPLLPDGYTGEVEVVVFPGPQGLPGQDGLDGLNGLQDLRPLGFVFQQNAAATTWTITHPLDFRPHVDIYDSAGTLIEGAEIVHPPSGLSPITFTAPYAFAGWAVLS